MVSSPWSWALLSFFASMYKSEAYWLEDIPHHGIAPYNKDGSSYNVFRDVRSLGGALGNGQHDDTEAFNRAIAQGARCAPSVKGCKSSTNSPAVVYVPSGIYLISKPIVLFYMTQLIGDPTNPPVLKAVSNFTGSIVDGDPYESKDPDYEPTNIFARQVRNFIFDMSAVDPAMKVTGIHWPTAQATSLQNLHFKMAQSPNSTHTGVSIESGSGGLLTDLTFDGGGVAMSLGCQQFTTKNIKIANAVVAIDQLWDWGWTYIGLTIDNCAVGLNMSSGGREKLAVGSVNIIDSIISNTDIAVITGWDSSSSPAAADSLVLENVIFTNVKTGIQGSNTVVENSPGVSITIPAWVEGHTYDGAAGASSPVKTQGGSAPFPRAASLLTHDGKYFTWTKPQYESLDKQLIKSIRDEGATGDGKTDDFHAVQAALDKYFSTGNPQGIVLYFDAGIYLVSDTINIHPGAIIVGEAYPTIMGASGSHGNRFADMKNPQPVVRVGEAGDTGKVEWSDMIIATFGSNPGATLIEWNLSSDMSAPSGMWDVHTRIGGFLGSDLQLAQCATTMTQPNTDCVAAFQSMHVTKHAQGLYMENVWLWTADHDIDDADNTKLTIYTGRGLLVEASAGGLWLIGTSVEHHALYQYQFADTSDVFMGFVQTETPYYQPVPQATLPFDPVPSLNDPDFAAFCAGKPDSCFDAWGIRIINSKDIMIYGAGLYSFFSNYIAVCSANNATSYNEDCQSQILGIDEGGSSADQYSGSTVWVYGLNTIGSISMIDEGGASLANQADNRNSFAETIVRFSNVGS